MKLKRTILKSLNRYFGPRPIGIVLLYHRVINLAADPQLLCVSPRNFAEHLDVLRRRFRLITATELLNSNHFNLEKEPFALVTFDDGYADNFNEAYPLLERAGVPGLFFVATARLDQHSEFYWDALQNLFLEIGDLPPELRLRVREKELRYSLASCQRFDASTTKRYRAWSVLDPEIPTTRHVIYKDLCQEMRVLTAQERCEILSFLEKWAARTIGCREEYGHVSRAQIKKLADSSLISIGAHTVNHCSLSSLSSTEQERELVESKKMLEEITQKQVSAFSYPYGSSVDYTKQTISLLKDTKYTHSFNTLHSPVNYKSDIWQIPRIVVRNWAAEEFEKRCNEAMFRV